MSLPLLQLSGITSRFPCDRFDLGKPTEFDRAEEAAQQRIDAQQSRRGMGAASFQKEVDNGVITGVIENKGDLEELTTTLKKALDNQDFWKQKK